MKKMNRKGFTIVELVIVIAVIAILAGVLIPTFSGIVTKAQISAAEQQFMNAYKEGYAYALADDGLVTANEVEKVGDKFQVTFSTANSNAATVAIGTFSVSDGTETFNNNKNINGYKSATIAADGTITLTAAQ